MAMFRTELTKGPLMRVSYAYGLFKPRENDSGNKIYSATFILPKEDAVGMKQLQSMVAECVMGEWGEKGVERFKKGLIKNPMLDGAGKEAHDKDGNLREGLGSDFIFIRPSSQKPPKVFDAKVLPASESDVQSGYWGYPVLNCFAWHNPKNGDGVSFGVSMFQMTKKDDVLAGSDGGDPADFFKKEAIDADASAGSGGDASSMFD